MAKKKKKIFFISPTQLQKITLKEKQDISLFPQVNGSPRDNVFESVNSIKENSLRTVDVFYKNDFKSHLDCRKEKALAEMHRSYKSLLLRGSNKV